MSDVPDPRHAPGALPACAVAALVTSAALGSLLAPPPWWVGGGAACGLAALWRWCPAARPLAIGRALAGGVLLVALAASWQPWPRCDLERRLGQARTQVELGVRVERAPEARPDGWRAEVSVLTLEGERLDPPPRAQMTFPAEHLARAPLPGDHLRTWARLEAWPRAALPHQRGRRAAMRRRGLQARATALEPPVWGRVSRDPGARLRRWLARRRLGLEARVRRHLPADEAAIALAMTLGSRGLLEPHQRLPFDLTGTSHLLAISGLHLGALAAILWVLARALAWAAPRAVARHGLARIAGAPVLAVLAGYVVMIGAPLSARRALMMAAALLGARAWMRRLDALYALSVAGLVVALWRPQAATEPALWLSLSATAGILLLVGRRPHEEPARTWPRRLARAAGQGARVSLGAWLGTAPAVLALRAELPLVGLLLNPAYVPLVSLLLFPLMLAGLALIGPAPALGAWLLGLGAQGVAALGRGAAWAAALPGACWRPGPMSGWMLALLAVAILGGLAAWPRRRRLAWAAAALAVALLAWPSLQRALAPPRLTLYFLPVGQGDATLIVFPDGYTMLVDGGGTTLGPDPGLTRVVPALRWLGIHRLDEVVLTHPDVDHMRGLFAVAELARPRAYTWAPVRGAEPEPDEARALRARMLARRARPTPLHEARVLERGGVTARLLAPDPAGATGRNDRSVTVELSWGPTRLLLPGDLEAHGERWLLERGQRPVALLKVPHHGSKTSSTPALLARARPAVAVVSAGGRSRFGHPHPEVVARYQRLGASIWHTGRQGLVTVTVEPEGQLRVRALHPWPHSLSPARP